MNSLEFLYELSWAKSNPLKLESFAALLCSDTNIGNRATQKTKLFLALKPRSSLQGGGNGSHSLLIELAKEFVDDEVDVVTSQFLQLTSVSREKMYHPPLAPMI
jgi:hypothetical protein